MSKRAPSGTRKIQSAIKNLTSRIGLKKAAQALGVAPSTVRRQVKNLLSGRAAYHVLGKKKTLNRWEDRLESAERSLAPPPPKVKRKAAPRGTRTLQRNVNEIVNRYGIQAVADSMGVSTSTVRRLTKNLESGKAAYNVVGTQRTFDNWLQRLDKAQSNLIGTGTTPAEELLPYEYEGILVYRTFAQAQKARPKLEFRKEFTSIDPAVLFFEEVGAGADYFILVERHITNKAGTKVVHYRVYYAPE